MIIILSILVFILACFIDNLRKRVKDLEKRVNKDDDTFYRDDVENNAQ